GLSPQARSATSGADENLGGGKRRARTCASAGVGGIAAATRGVLLSRQRRDFRDREAHRGRWIGIAGGMDEAPRHRPLRGRRGKLLGERRRLGESLRESRHSMLGAAEGICATGSK